MSRRTLVVYSLGKRRLAFDLVSCLNTPHSLLTGGHRTILSPHVSPHVLRRQRRPPLGTPPPLTHLSPMSSHQKSLRFAGSPSRPRDGPQSTNVTGGTMFATAHRTQETRGPMGLPPAPQVRRRTTAQDGAPSTQTFLFTDWKRPRAPAGDRV